MISWRGSGNVQTEQADAYVKSVESFMEEMKPTENTKHDGSMNRPYNAEYEQDR